VGKTKASVLPLPVGAETHTSLGRHKEVARLSSRNGITCVQETSQKVAPQPIKKGL